MTNPNTGRGQLIGTLVLEAMKLKNLQNPERHRPKKYDNWDLEKQGRRG